MAVIGTFQAFTATQYASFDIQLTTSISLDNLVRSNILIAYSSGDDIEDITYSISGSAFTYTIAIQLPPDKKGVFTITASGNVILSLGGTKDTISPSPISITYDTTETVEPVVENIDMPAEITTGNLDILIDFNTEVVGLSVNSFIFTGLDDIPTPTILYATTPDPIVSPPATDRTLTGSPPQGARFYLLRFTFAEIPTGTLNIALEKGGARAYTA